MNNGLKRIFILLVSLPLLFIFAGCNAKSEKEDGSLETRITELEAENKRLKDELESLTGEEGVSTDNRKKSPTEDKAKKNVIGLGEAVVIDDYAEMALEKTDLAKRINPPNPDTVFSYYETKEAGNIYLDTVVNVKSLLTTAKTSDEFLNVKVQYDGKYEYDTFSAIEENGGTDFTSSIISDIDPLLSQKLHFLAEIPETIANDDKPIEIILSIQGKEYWYKLK